MGSLRRSEGADRCARSPSAPLLVIGRGIRDWLGRLLGTLGEEGALVTAGDHERSLEATVLAKTRSARAGDRIELGRARPSEGDSVPHEPGVDVSEYGDHAESVTAPRPEREERSAKQVEVLRAPGACLGDPPPTGVLERDRIVRHRAA